MDKSFVKSVSTLIFGASFSKAIGFLSSLVLTRLYEPDDFGIFALYISLTILTSSLLSLRYSQAIPLPKSEYVAICLIKACFILVMSLASITTIVFFLLFELTTLWGGMISTQLLFLVICSSTLLAINEIYKAYAIRTKNFAIIAIEESQNSLTAASAKVSCYFINSFANYGLLLGHLFAVVISTVLLVFRFSSTIKSKASRTGHILRVLKNYADFPVFRFPSQFLLLFSMQMPIFFFASVFSEEYTGYLGLALSVISVPLMLISQAVSQAYLGEIAALGRKKVNEIRHLTVGITRHLFLLSSIPFTLLILFGEELFSVIFGESWAKAGEFTQILAFAMCLQFCSNPIGHCLSVFKRNDLFLKLNTIRAFCFLICFFTAYVAELSPESTLIAYTVTAFGFYGSFMLFIFIFLKNESVKGS